MTDAELEALLGRPHDGVAAAVGAEIGAAIVDDPRILAGSRWTVRRVSRWLATGAHVGSDGAFEVELVTWPGHVFRDDLVERALDGSPLAFLRATMPEGGRSPDLVAATDAVREIVARVARPCATRTRCASTASRTSRRPASPPSGSSRSRGACDSGRNAPPRDRVLTTVDAVLSCIT